MSKPPRKTTSEFKFKLSNCLKSEKPEKAYFLSFSESEISEILFTRPSDSSFGSKFIVFITFICNL